MATIHEGPHAHPHSTAKIGGHPIHPMLIPFPIVCFYPDLRCGHRLHPEPERRLGHGDALAAGDWPWIRCAGGGRRPYRFLRRQAHSAC